MLQPLPIALWEMPLDRFFSGAGAAPSQELRSAPRALFRDCERSSHRRCGVSSPLVSILRQPDLKRTDFASPGGKGRPQARYVARRSTRSAVPKLRSLFMALAHGMRTSRKPVMRKYATCWPGRPANNLPTSGVYSSIALLHYPVALSVPFDHNNQFYRREHRLRSVQSFFYYSLCVLSGLPLALAAPGASVR